ncbi:MAG: DUF554 domain-containing protein [Anaerolineaceae bacterium]|jgi:uncharacterized membrane protein YqgA involved in biofilm formation
MTGTLLNIATILIGGVLGLILGSRLPERLRQMVVSGLGLFTLAYGFSMFLETENPLVVLGSLLVGAVLGEWLQIENGLQNLGAWLEQRVMKGNAENQARFVRGFLIASLVYCVGPMAILGSIQDGLSGDYNLLAVKSVLDGFASLAFASTLGVGVMFSVLPILVYQGGISLLAAQAEAFVTPAMMNEMSAVGGVILLSIAISSLLEIRPIRSANFLPAIIIAPIVTALLAWVGLFTG